MKSLKRATRLASYKKWTEIISGSMKKKWKETCCKINSLNVYMRMASCYKEGNLRHWLYTHKKKEIVARFIIARMNGHQPIYEHFFFALSKARLHWVYAYKALLLAMMIINISQLEKYLIKCKNFNGF
jgi:hypothetical protein